MGGGHYEDRSSYALGGYDHVSVPDGSSVLTLLNRLISDFSQKWVVIRMIGSYESKVVHTVF